MDLGLSGKVAMVTGGGSGIGEAIVHRFAAEGATVVSADLNGDNAKASPRRPAPQPRGDPRHLVLRAGEGHRGRNRRAPRAPRRARQLRGGVAHRAVHGRAPGGLGVRGQHEPPRHHQLHPRRPRPDGRAGRRQDRQHLFGRGSGRRVPTGGLLRGEGGDSSGSPRRSRARWAGAASTSTWSAPVTPRPRARPGSSTRSSRPASRRATPSASSALPDDVAKMAVFLASDGASHITGQTISVSGGYSMV